MCLSIEMMLRFPQYASCFQPLCCKITAKQEENAGSAEIGSDRR